MSTKVIPTNPAYTEAEYNQLNNYFIRACRWGDAPQVNALLVLGANVNAASSETRLNGMTGLHVAALNGRVNVLRELIRRGAKINALDALGATPLILAASEGQHHAVNALLAAGADPNGEDNFGRTALHYACRVAAAPGQFVTSALLASGAKPDSPSKDGLTPLLEIDFVSENGSWSLQPLLLTGAKLLPEQANAWDTLESLNQLFIKTNAFLGKAPAKPVHQLFLWAVSQLKKSG